MGDRRRATALRVFDTALGRIGILIGYDAEFPLLGARHGRGGRRDPAGAELHRQPAAATGGCGSARRPGRSRTSAWWCTPRPSATADWLPHRRDAPPAPPAIYGPPDVGFPEDGVIAVGKPDAAGWVHGEVSLEALRQARDRRCGAALPATGPMQPARGADGRDGDAGGVRPDALARAGFAARTLRGAP